MTHHLAQVNVARLREPIEHPLLADFVGQLDAVNALADDAPGFVWRLETDEGNATSIQAFEEDVAEGAGMIVNLSVWTDIERLKDFVYGVQHASVMRRRREWFHPMAEAYAACWWVPIGEVPTTDDAEDRVKHLREHGPTDYAFTLKRSFPAPGRWAAESVPIA